MNKYKLSLKKQVIENSFWSIICSIINRIGGFIFVVIVSRSLMPEGFGIYTLAMTIALFFITFADLGINQTLIRYVSYEIDKDNNKAAAYFKYLFKIKIYLTCLFSLLLILVAYPLSVYILKKPSIFILLIILSLYVFFISLTGFFESLFFVRKEVKYISFKESLFQSARILSALFVAYIINLKFKILSITSLSVIISILILFFVLYYSRKIFPFLFKKSNGKIDKKRILKFIFFLNIENIFLLIFSQASVIFLGIFLTSEYIGYFSAALTLISISSLFVFTPIFLPVFTKLKGKKFEIALQKVFRVIMILIIPASFGLSILSKYFIVLIYGYNYLPAKLSLSILSFLMIPITATNLFLVSFSAKEKPKEFAKLIFISAILYLILNYFFIKYFINISYGMSLTGVAIANLISWFFYFILSIFLLKKELKINILSFWLLKPIISSLIMSISVFLFLIILKDMNILNGVLLVLSGVVIYFAFMLLIKGIRKEEIGLIKNINIFGKLKK